MVIGVPCLVVVSMGASTLCPRRDAVVVRRWEAFTGGTAVLVDAA
jgi:hypothetical protein